VNSTIIGQFIGSFAISMGFAVIWLIIVKIIPSLRKKSPKDTYVIAMIIGALPVLLMYGDAGPVNYAATVVCIVILLWQKKRAEALLKHSRFSS